MDNSARRRKTTGHVESHESANTKRKLEKPPVVFRRRMLVTVHKFLQGFHPVSLSPRVVDGPSLTALQNCRKHKMWILGELFTPVVPNHRKCFGQVISYRVTQKDYHVFYVCLINNPTLNNAY